MPPTLELHNVNCFVFCVCFFYLVCLVSIRICLVLFQSLAYVQVIIRNKYLIWFGRILLVSLLIWDIKSWGLQFWKIFYHWEIMGWTSGFSEILESRVKGGRYLLLWRHIRSAVLDDLTFGRSFRMTSHPVGHFGWAHIRSAMLDDATSGRSYWMMA